ncbi:MAG TPA: CDP-diacylglycerol--serine O-phosphatidyltransferase [Polyangiaceae bacterium]|nr:CDP-diacylglycerol--serine O-phosphatidyltransferase [Polyangiaceae bacterium]
MKARGKGRHSRQIQRLDLQRTLFVLPNMITLASIFCGFNAIRVVALDNPSVDDFYRAAILLMFATFFDLMDGRVARMTRTQSAFGLQLDSLSDIVSFGVAPSILVYKWVLYKQPLPGIFVAFLFMACGAIRLARFNVLNSSSSGTPVKPGKYIVGLPIPPAAGILISLLLANKAVGGALGQDRYTVGIFVIMVVLSLLMVSTIKFRSFKDLAFNAGTALFVLFVIGSSAVVWVFSEPQFVLLWLLSFYIFIGLFETVRHFAGALRGGAPEAHASEVAQPSGTQALSQPTGAEQRPAEH